MPSADPINTTLADWLDWWLVVTCPCGRRADLPMKMLARRYGTGAQMHHFAARLRCASCGAAPASAELVDHVQYLAPGFAGAGTPKRIPLDP